MPAWQNRYHLPEARLYDMKKRSGQAALGVLAYEVFAWIGEDYR